MMSFSTPLLLPTILLCKCNYISAFIYWFLTCLITIHLKRYIIMDVPVQFSLSQIEYNFMHNAIA